MADTQRRRGGWYAMTPAASGEKLAGSGDTWSGVPSSPEASRTGLPPVALPADPASPELTTFIYAVVSRPDGRYGYLGKSDDPDRRLRQHVRDVLNGGSRRNGGYTKKEAWIRSCLDAGSHVEVVVLDEIPADQWPERETRWIAECKKRGLRLTNTAPGGEGFTSEEVKALWADPEWRDRVSKSLSRAQTGSSWSPAMRETMSRPEVKAKKSAAQSAGLLALWAEPEYAARMSKRLSEAISALWQDPEWRDRASKAISGAANRPEVRAKRSELSKAYWAEPDYAKRVSQGVSEALRGRPLSESHCQALSEAHKGKPLSEAHLAATLLGWQNRFTGQYDCAPGMKVCRDCRRPLPATLASFQHYSRHSDGLSDRCHDCWTARRAAKQVTT